MIRPVLIALLLVGAAAQAQTRRLAPVDQCAADASFAAFRTQLRAAVARRDLAFIESIIADDIQSSFGGDPGRADFLAHWRLDRPAASGFWRELETALRLGCARIEDGAMWAPSLSARWDPADDDFTPTFVAIVPGAALRASASDAGRILASLEWDVLTAPGNDGAGEWLAARLADGRRGYVRRSQVRDLADYRAVFEKRGGRWRMTAFVAGD